MDLTKYDFLYNAAAHFHGVDAYPPDGLYKELTKNGTDGFKALCWALTELATQGELARAALGQDKRPVPDAEQFELNLKTYEIGQARTVVMEAIVKGLKPPEEDDDTETDEVLEELAKKTNGD